MKSVYCWHEPDHEAIKVGIGNGPQGRMVDYSACYGLNPDKKSLCVFPVPTGFDAQHIESRCHALLVKRGMIRFPGNVTELFRLKGNDYRTVADLVGSFVEHCIACIRNEDNIDLNFEPRKPMDHEEMHRLALGETGTAYQYKQYPDTPPTISPPKPPPPPTPTVHRHTFLANSLPYIEHSASMEKEVQ